MDFSTQPSEEENRIEKIQSELLGANPSKKKRVFEAFTLAALGSIPWVGGFISAAASLKFDEDEVKTDTLQTQWLEEHKAKLTKLQETMEYMLSRFDNIGEEIDDRLASPEYLDLVRKGFRVWNEADTDEKRKYIADLLTNASSISLTSDDVVRLFIDWLEKYHEIHFAVIREIYNKPGSTRFSIWTAIHPNIPQENSAEADLYRMIIRDLSTGGVIRQERDTTATGEFIKKGSRKGSGSTSRTMESAFEDTKPYELTALGQQFVHYAMTELVPRMGE